MGKYTKILIGAILLSLANKILLGNIEDIPKPAMKIFSAI